MEYGLVGEKLGHSFSGELHAALGGYHYELRPMDAAQFEAFMQARDFKGINVTIPYKQRAIPFCAELSPLARRIGAVNTIVNKNGRLVGHNTDYDGFAALLRHAGISLRAKTVLVLGSGGTRETVRTVAEDAGAAAIYTAGRTAKAGVLPYAEAAQLPGVNVVVNTTPVGMYPKNDSMPMDLSGFSHLEAVADVIYNPLQTRLLAAAKAQGAVTAGGLYMLAAQAKAAAELFTGGAIGDDVLSGVYAGLLGQMANVSLIGMPGCGKSTVGRLLAAHLGRPFVDLDEMVVETARMPIPEIFSQFGEARFRALEAEAAAEAGKRHGLVIACGGGTVLREDNMVNLAQNGPVIYLERALCDICPGEGRPLTQSAEDLAGQYSARKPLYEQSASLRLPTGKTAAATALAAQNAFLQFLDAVARSHASF